MACHNKNILYLFWTLTFLLTCHDYNHWKVLLLLLLTCLSIISASVLEEIPNSFLIISSLNIVFYHVDSYHTIWGWITQWYHQSYPQLSGKELNKNKVYTSSSSSSFMVDNSLNSPWQLLNALQHYYHPYTLNSQVFLS